jgi:inositol oxygenase
MEEKFKNRQKNPLNIWDALESLNNFVDSSDPDITLPNYYHLIQTAEGIRKADLPDWLQVIGLIHDLGKIQYLDNNPELGTSLDTQWGVVGDTFIVGYPLPESIVYPEFNQLNKDHKTQINNQKINNQKINIKNGCGLESIHCSWGHDEYLYRVLMEEDNKNLIPEIGLYIIRYHSLYPWNTGNAYSELESSKDRVYKPIVQEFNKFDLYTKDDKEFIPSQDIILYYKSLINKYFPYNNQIIYF